MSIQCVIAENLQASSTFKYNHNESKISFPLKHILQIFFHFDRNGKTNFEVKPQHVLHFILLFI